MKRPLILSMIFASAIAVPAVAGSVKADQFEFAVTFDRTALDNPATVASEYENIREQVEVKCEAENSGFNPIRKMVAVNKCVNFTMKNTIAEIDNQTLTAHFKERSFG